MTNKELNRQLGLLLLNEDGYFMSGTLDWLYSFVRSASANPRAGANWNDAINRIFSTMGNNVSKNFDGMVTWFKSSFSNNTNLLGETNPGIFRRIFNGIIGICNTVIKWLGDKLHNFTPLKATVPGAGFTFGTMIAWCLVASLAIVAFYKIFKGLFGKTKWDRNSQLTNPDMPADPRLMPKFGKQGDNQAMESAFKKDLDNADKFILELYNAANSKVNMLQEGVIGGIFTFFGSIIKRAFKLVGEIISDIWSAMKKRPFLSFFVLVLCFFVCLGMNSNVMSNFSTLANGGKSSWWPDWIANSWNSVRGVGASALSGTQTFARGAAAGINGAARFANPLNWLTPSKLF